MIPAIWRSLLVGASVWSCSNGVSSDLGRDAGLQIVNAQFTEGLLATPTDGPDVESLDLLTNTIWPGYFNKSVRGTLGAEATAVNVMLSGDRGYWVILAQPPDVAQPNSPTFRATAAFSPKLVADEYALLLQAVASDGRVGAVLERQLTYRASAPRQESDARLAVELTWDTDADLDLHVVDPRGVEIFHGQKTSYDGFSPAGSNDDSSPGVLDFDSNADCQIDGQRRETVSWQTTPPAGQYLVRIDAKSLCGEAIARFNVSVTSNDVRIAHVTGVSVDADTWGSHDRGAGVLAIEFSAP